MCLICFDKPISVAIEPCQHSFCDECIYRWTKEHQTCPLCRVKTPKIMNHAQENMERRDALIVELTTALREFLDDEKKRLKAAIKLR